ncbi:hypothetical protein [Thioalkalivibrio sp. XN8]|uniref:hypothetical protein n=1 Tax=Thioalkalivibrio sp. XN8 TaxID=2712863 RepID=UPI0013EA15FF|nr:hypothetical protein [Thioalkalivibrio sp. XN8]NGP52758.1 hypothetical protein [Thioalkalivibrio sp. XN8]
MNTRCSPRGGREAGWLPAATGVLLALVVPASAGAAGDREAGIAVGTEFVSGEYGGEERVEEWYTRFSGWVRLGRVSLQLTVPWLSVDAPAGTVIDGPGGPVIGDGPRRTESGIGDVTAAVTLRDVWQAADGAAALDLAGEVKLGTADEDQGLGSGETDITLRADYLAFFDRWTGLASLGYTVRGDPAGFELDDGIVAAAGGLFRVTAANRAGVFLEYRQAAYFANDDPLELTGFYSWRAGPWRTSLSLRAGLSDSAPDWGAGLSLATTF